MASILAHDFEVEVDTALYSTEVVLRACYRLTDRFYVFLLRSRADCIAVRLTPKDPSVALNAAGELSNTLIDEAVRQSVREETAAIREVIVRTALSEIASDA